MRRVSCLCSRSRHIAIKGRGGERVEYVAQSAGPFEALGQGEQRRVHIGEGADLGAREPFTPDAPPGVGGVDALQVPTRFSSSRASAKMWKIPGVERVTRMRK